MDENEANKFLKDRLSDNGFELVGLSDNENEREEQIRILKERRNEIYEELQKNKTK